MSDDDKSGDDEAEGEEDDVEETREDSLTEGEVDCDGLVVTDALADPLPLGLIVPIGEPDEVSDGNDEALFVALIDTDRVAEGDWVLLADSDAVFDTTGSVELVARDDFVRAGFELDDGEREGREEPVGVRDVVVDFDRPAVREMVITADVDGCDTPDAVSIDDSDLIAPVDREIDGEALEDFDVPLDTLTVAEESGVGV